MAEERDVQHEAARAAAGARKAIAERIRKLAPGVEKDVDAQIVRDLAEAYAHLAAEPPRVRS
jgi:hypothetical protein